MAENARMLHVARGSRDGARAEGLRHKDLRQEDFTQEDLTQEDLTEEDLTQEALGGPTMRGASSLLAAWVAALLPAALGPAAAETYPARPITLVVPFAPGGSASTVARSVADKMSETLGQQIVIDNRGGAGGTVATRA